MTVAITAPVYAEEFFNPAFLSDDPAAVADLSRFEKGEGQAPGACQGSCRLSRFMRPVFPAPDSATLLPAGSSFA
ncbi:hypothetical protein, partial [Serratia ficaria]|uniref:hypothetical protein n=1 Tax=Serratia ficaria TaxID=61651 RepID=UPI0021C77EA1